MVSAGINYRETYFEFPELTKLQGEPNAESLYKLRNELKANAQAVTSSLSDGDHGHLALVLSATQYALLTDQPFVRPVHPGELVIAPSASNAIATVIKGAHDEAVRLFREVQGVEKALVQLTYLLIRVSTIATYIVMLANSRVLSWMDTTTCCHILVYTLIAVTCDQTRSCKIGVLHRCEDNTVYKRGGGAVGTDFILERERAIYCNVSTKDFKPAIIVIATPFWTDDGCRRSNCLAGHTYIITPSSIHSYTAKFRLLIEMSSSKKNICLPVHNNILVIK